MKKLFKLLPFGFIFLLFLIFAFPYWAKGRVPFPADYLVNAFPPWQYYNGIPVKNSAMPDVVGQMYPYKHLAITLWKEGIVPLWNPYMFSGTPFLANYQSAVFHPANFLFFLLPEIDAWSIMILLQSLLAGWFTFLFARRLGSSVTGGLLAAVSFMFCGFMTTWMAYGTMSWAVLWLPVVLYFIEKNFGKKSFWSRILLSFSLAASFLSGHFQISVYVLLTALAYVLYKFLFTKNFKALATTVVFIALGLGIAASQILPSLELHGLAVRSKVFGISEIIPWNYWPTLFAPDFYGNDVTRNAWFGHYAEWSSFAGVIPLILAFYFSLKRKSHQAWFFVILALGSFFLARPTFLNPLIFKARLPIFSSSAASRINCLFSFSLAILGGLGLDRLIIELREKKYKTIFAVSLLFVLTIAGLYGFLVLSKPFSPENLAVAKRNLILPSALILLFLGTIISSWLIGKLAKKAYGFWTSLIIFVLLVSTTFDLLRFANKWVPFDARKNVYPPVPILEYLPKKAGFDRVFGYIGLEMQNYFEIQGFNGYDPLYIQRYGELLMAANNPQGLIELPSTRGVGLERRAKYTIPLMNLMGGKYVLHAVGDARFDWTFNFWSYPKQYVNIYKDEKYEVYENKMAFPRAFLAYDYEVETDNQKIVDKMLKSGLDLRKTIILEEDIGLYASNNSPGRVKITRYEPLKVMMVTETSAPALLFLSDSYYPGWKAYVDNQETKIYRADYAFRAVKVPEGEHQVSFIYQPESFNLGLKISLISLLALVILSFL